MSCGKAEKKCGKILKDQSSGEAKHSAVRWRKIEKRESKVGGVRQCCFER